MVGGGVRNPEMWLFPRRRCDFCIFHCLQDPELIVWLQDLYHFRDSQGAKRGEGFEGSGRQSGSAGAEVLRLQRNEQFWIIKSGIDRLAAGFKSVADLARRNRPCWASLCAIGNRTAAPEIRPFKLSGCLKIACPAMTC